MKRTRFDMFGLVCALVMGCVPQEVQRPTAALMQPRTKQPCFGAPTGPYMRLPIVCARGVVAQVTQLLWNMDLVSSNNADEAKKFTDYVRGMRIMLDCRGQFVFPQQVQDGMWLVFTRYLGQVQAKDSTITDCSPELAALASLVPAPEGK